MADNIFLSKALFDKYPDLSPKLVALFDINSAGEDVEISVGSTFADSVKTVQWSSYTDNERQVFSALWLDTEDLAIHFRDCTLTKLITDFRRSQDLEDSAQPTLLLVHAHPDFAIPDRSQVDVEMARRDLQFHCVHRFADTLDQAAYIIYVYTRGLWKMIANPTPEEVFRDYSAMLSVIPGMTPDRVLLVTSQYRNWRSLREALKRIKSHVEAGSIVLNSSLFSGTPADANSEEIWVYNLYTIVVGAEQELIVD
ncbi:hypothetical protein V5O48_008610 [Marasmius crinis-equi]|uniref:Uncharacterized protein n=1 Tax=Marasmius crinis-equi TaxID=585013 RepID=A0ABR3FDJ2_9AGAR